MRAPSGVGTDAKTGRSRQMSGMQVDKGDARLLGPVTRFQGCQCVWSWEIRRVTAQA
jgi:hypothetical protein